MTYSDGYHQITHKQKGEGKEGPEGPPGPKVQKGDTGSQGPAGPKGDVGPQGPSGSKGDTGPQGPAGPKGDTGPKGDVGSTGPKGDTGPQGQKGDTGSQGPAGPKGDTGPRGPAGPRGSNVNLSNYLDRTKGGSIQKALNFIGVNRYDRQITGISDQPANGTSVINLNKLNTELNKKLDTTTFNTSIVKKSDSNAVILRNGSQSMTGNLNLGNNKVINSAAPTSGSDLCNKTYVDTYVNNQLSHSVSNKLKNDLDYIMNDSQFSDEDDITGKTMTTKDFHNFNKKVKSFELKLDSSKGYYSSRFGVNMYTAAKSEYTIVCEVWWESSKIDYNLTEVTAASSVEKYTRKRSNRFSNHTRTLVHLTKWSDATPNYLMWDIVVKFKQGQAYDQKLDIWVVVYGTKGYHNDIPVEVYDRWYSLENGKLNLYPETVLSNEPTTDKNPATKKYVDTLQTTLQTNIDTKAKKIWYRGSLSHNNKKTVQFYVNGTANHSINVSQSDGADFTVNSSDPTKLIVNNAGLYLITFIDGLASTQASNLKFILGNEFVDTNTNSGGLTIPLENTSTMWKTTLNTVMLYFQANTSLKMEADHNNTVFDGLNYSYIMLAKQD